MQSFVKKALAIATKPVVRMVVAGQLAMDDAAISTQTHAFHTPHKNFTYMCLV
jgi:hypothetical protein